MKSVKEFQLANEMLEKVLGGNASPLGQVFTFTGAYAERQAQSIGHITRGCGCGCGCAGGAGNGSGAGR